MIGTLLAQLANTPQSHYEELAYALRQYKILQASYAQRTHRMVPPTELPALLDMLITSTTEAVGRKAVHPWYDVTTIAYASLFAFDLPAPTTGVDGVNRDVGATTGAPQHNSVVLAGHEFIIDCGRPAFRRTERYQQALERSLGLLEAIEREADNTMRIAIKEDDMLHEHVAFCRAQIVVLDDKEDYHILDIGTTGGRVDVCNPPRMIGRVDHKTALAACDAKLISSICVAPGSHYYPLVETTLPVLMEKYARILGLPRVESHRAPFGMRPR